MQVNLRHKGTITILDIEGKVIGTDALALKNIIYEQISDTENGTEKLKLILNMERVQTMDSSGLGTLIAAHNAIRRHKGRIGLLSLGHNIRNLIVMAKLISIFQCYDSEAEAIAGILKS